MRVTIHWALHFVHADNQMEGACVPGVISCIRARDFLAICFSSPCFSNFVFCAPNRRFSWRLSELDFPDKQGDEARSGEDIAWLHPSCSLRLPRRGDFTLTCLPCKRQGVVIPCRRIHFAHAAVMSDGPLGKAPDVSGLANRRGNQNCWMNAIVQSLANVTQLETAVLHARSASGGRPTLLGELQLAFTAMRCRGVFELVTLRNLLGECLMARACSRTLLLNVCVPNG
jgi:hypothetical protein